MRNEFMSITIIVLLICLGCNPSAAQKKEETNTKPVVENNNEVDIYNRLTEGLESDASKARILPLYKTDSLRAIASVCERKVEKFYGEKRDQHTAEKTVLNERNDGLKDSISFFFQDKHVIALEKRTLLDHKKINHEIFFFDDHNSCIGRSTHHANWSTSYRDVLFDDSLVRYDNSERILPLAETQKQQIIQEAKTSLYSLMQLFPGFEYTFNWK